MHVRVPFFLATLYLIAALLVEAIAQQQRLATAVALALPAAVFAVIVATRTPAKHPAKRTRIQRESLLANASERIRESLSSALVARAIVREALAALGVTSARWYPLRDGESLIGSLGGAIEPVEEPMPPELASVARRAIEEERALLFTGSDALARLVLDRLDSSSAMAIPVRDTTESYGVLIITSQDPFDDESLVFARTFANIAATALAQARLFGELAQRNEALIERQEVIRDLVYALSHDLRTPLAALALTLKQAREGAFGPLPHPYHEILAASLISIDDLRRLAETLLLVARIEAGEHKSRPETFDLRTMLNDVLAEFEAMAQSHQVTLELTGTSVSLWADRADVRRALVNLIANGLQHMGQNGTLSVNIDTQDREIVITVRDDGFGVPAERRPYLFQRFSGGAGGGSGLGLYLVRRIAEANGGHVQYQSADPRGSVFRLTLPQALAKHT